MLPYDYRENLNATDMYGWQKHTETDVHLQVVFSLAAIIPSNNRELRPLGYGDDFQINFVAKAVEEYHKNGATVFNPHIHELVNGLAITVLSHPFKTLGIEKVPGSVSSLLIYEGDSPMFPRIEYVWRYEQDVSARNDMFLLGMKIPYTDIPLKEGSSSVLLEPYDSTLELGYTRVAPEKTVIIPSVFPRAILTFLKLTGSKITVRPYIDE